MADKETTKEKNGSDFRNGTTIDNVVGRRGLPMIQTHKKVMDSSEICHDDSSPSVKAQTIHELHSLQKKKNNKSTPNTPIRSSTTTQSPFASISEEERQKQKQQLQSIRYLHIIIILMIDAIYELN